MKRKLSFFAAILVIPLLLSACAFPANVDVSSSSGNNLWTVGFGSGVIIPENTENNPLYIAGYNQGWAVNSYVDNSRLSVYEDMPLT